MVYNILGTMRVTKFFYQEKYFSNMSLKEIATYFQFIVIAKALEINMSFEHSGFELLILKEIKLEDYIYSVN